MKIAVIPWGNEGLKNKIFDISDVKSNRDNIMMPQYLLKKEMERRGVEFNTIDFYDDLQEVDFFIFYYFDKQVLLQLLKKGYINKLIYFNGEPEVVEKRNGREGVQNTLNYFKYVMTWNDSLIDGKRIHKRIIPYYFEDRRVENKLKFSEKKLLVNISGAKTSNHPLEMYSERLKVIEYFEKKHQDEFEFYGQGWKEGDYKNYGGAIANKAVVYSRFKFALALENMKGVKGYITEKIFDCFTAGIVPIYQGASNVQEFIPDNCYIHYDEFEDLDKLYCFLAAMNEETYNQYLDNISTFLCSNVVQYFSAEEQCKYIMHVCECSEVDIVVSNKYLIQLQMSIWKDCIKGKIKGLKNKVLGK